jgi:hypothetical protein
MEQTTRLCTLEAAVGKAGACPEKRCPFWEPGGAALGGRCAVEDLGLVADVPLATYLHELRAKLETASSEDEQQARRSAFHQLLSSTSE